MFVRRLKRDDGYFATDRIARKHRTMKLEFHFARNEVHVAADLCGQRRRQQAMNHQTPLLVGRHVMHAFIARDGVEKPNVVFGKRPLPRSDIANLHRRILQLHHHGQRICVAHNSCGMTLSARVRGEQHAAGRKALSLAVRVKLDALGEGHFRLRMTLMAFESLALASISL